MYSLLSLIAITAAARRRRLTVVAAVIFNESTSSNSNPPPVTLRGGNSSSRALLCFRPRNARLERPLRQLYRGETTTAAAAAAPGLVDDDAAAAGHLKATTTPSSSCSLCAPKMKCQRERDEKNTAGRLSLRHARGESLFLGFKILHTQICFCRLQSGGGFTRSVESQGPRVASVCYVKNFPSVTKEFTRCCLECVKPKSTKETDIL